MNADLNAIQEGLQSRERGIRLAAAQALERVMKAELEAGRTDWSDLVGRFLPLLIAGIGDGEKGVQVHCANCLQFLAYQSEAVLPALRQALQPAHSRRAWGTAIVLARLGLWSGEVGQALAAAMGASDRDVRWAAAGFALELGRKNPGAVATVKATLRDGEPRARKMAAYCLGAMGAYADVEATLTAGLSDPDRDVRRAAVVALQKLPRVSPAAGRQVAALRQDPDPFVRRTADAVARRWGY